MNDSIYTRRRKGVFKHFTLCFQSFWGVKAITSFSIALAMIYTNTSTQVNTEYISISLQIKWIPFDFDAVVSMQLQRSTLAHKKALPQNEHPQLGMTSYKLGIYSFSKMLKIHFYSIHASSFSCVFIQCVFPMENYHFSMLSSGIYLLTRIYLLTPPNKTSLSFFNESMCSLTHWLLRWFQFSASSLKMIALNLQILNLR